jgi:hypothetical protein
MSIPFLRQVVGISISAAFVKDSVLVIIDAQDEYVHGELPAVDHKQVNLAIASPLKKYRKQNGQVVYVMHNSGSVEAPIFTPSGKLTKEMDSIEAINSDTIVYKKRAG